MQETFSSLLEDAMDAPDDYLDLRTLQSCKKQLALAGSLAREYGRITAKFSLKEQNLTGYIACESAEGTKWLQGRQENLESALTGLEKDREVGSLVILQGREIGGENYKPELRKRLLQP